MKLLPSHKKILEYLNKHGSANTFRLSKYLEIDRGELIGLVEGLADQGLAILQSGTVAKGNKEIEELKAAETKEAKKKPVSKPTHRKTVKKSNKHSELEKAGGKIKRLKKEIEDLQTQRNKIEQKLTKERALLYRIRKEKRKIKPKLPKKPRTKKRKKTKEKAKKQATKEFELKKKEPEQEEQKVKDIVSYPKITKPETMPSNLEKTYESLRQSPEEDRELPISEPSDFEHEEKKPTIKSKIRNIFGKITISKTETKQPRIMPKDKLEPAIKIEENVENSFHDLIEQEINLLKQKRIDEAREIHLRIKGMIGELEDINQVKTIVKDWNRIKDIYS